MATYSSGNHAQGVAYAARKLGVRATIVMPSSASKVKMERTAELGAEIVRVGIRSGLPVQPERLLAVGGHDYGVTVLAQIKAHDLTTSFSRKIRITEHCLINERELRFILRYL